MDLLNIGWSFQSNIEDINQLKPNEVCPDYKNMQLEVYFADLHPFLVDLEHEKYTINLYTT